jgi:hypothetical protein
MSPSAGRGIGHFEMFTPRAAYNKATQIGCREKAPNAAVSHEMRQ